ncbi:MAG: hypothetical protein J6Y78_09300 [Paludibacteraceae bacterium]|nr:hypothetical protein [Paludibacteraceae bacterium]
METDKKGMWEFLSEFLTKDNGFIILLLLVFVITILVIIGLAIKNGHIHLNIKGMKIGTDEAERNIIRRQVEWTHLYIMSLRAKIDCDESRYGGYLTKYILERCFDKIVEWITFNHISKNSAYVDIKQEEICALVYGLGVADQFKTPEFRERMCKWTKEVIEHLITIREVYQKEGN